jgi:hypothetical protein
MKYPKTNNIIAKSEFNRNFLIRKITINFSDWIKDEEEEKALLQLLM